MIPSNSYHFDCKKAQKFDLKLNFLKFSVFEFKKLSFFLGNSKIEGKKFDQKTSVFLITFISFF